MPRKFALKRLSASDLTLFKWHYQNHPAGNQKAINMNKAVMRQLYPALGAATLVQQPQYFFPLHIYGPGRAAAYTLTRKILLQEKNLRLNGEFIAGPVDDPDRFNTLAPDDFALFEFIGEAAPENMTMVLVARAVAEDVRLHDALNEVLGLAESMKVLDDGAIDSILAAARPPEDHPIRGFVETGLLEDAALGGADSIDRINRRAGRRGISPEDFVRSRQNAEATGVAGEVLLNAWLEDEQEHGRLLNYEWTSSINAIAPYDFRVTENDDVIRVIDAKSTSGGFNTPLHLSISELRTAVHGFEPYDIYRLYEVTGEHALMRIARDIGPVLREVLDTLETLPDGVTADSISINPEMLGFNDEVISVGHAAT